MCRSLLFVAIAVLAALSSGCGGADAGGQKYESARLEGEVTVDGAPIEDGTVQFVPASTSSGPVTQAVIFKGRYVANKVPLGKVTAIVHAAPPSRPETITSDYNPPKMVSIPSRYESGFPIEVKENKTDQDFSMSSKGS